MTAWFPIMAAFIANVVGAAPTPSLDIDVSLHERNGVLVIPKLDVRAPIREGTRVKQELDIGIGHLKNSVWPGESDTISFWGHRVTPTLGRPYGPFRYINRLRKDDRIFLKMPDGTHVYRVERHYIIRGTNTGFWRHSDTEVLYIAACHPPGSAEYRYVVKAVPTNYVYTR